MLITKTPKEKAELAFSIFVVKLNDFCIRASDHKSQGQFTTHMLLIAVGRRSKLKSHMLEVQQRVSWKKMKYTVRKLAMHTSVLIVVLGDRREMLKLLSDYSVVIKKAPRLQASRLLQINFANR